MKKLRKYQKEAISKILRHFKKNKKGLVQLPTGSGKTVIFWDLIKNNYKSALIIVPSIQLLYQCYEEGLNYFDEDEISRKGSRLKEDIKNYHIVITNSLCRQDCLELILRKHFEIIICDEAHRAVSPTYEKFFLSYLRKYPSLVLGMTATPERHDTRGLLSVFDHMIYKKEIYELIEEKYLSEIIAYQYKSKITIKNCAFSKGDFTTKSLFRQLNTDDRNFLILKAYKEKCLHRKTLIFCINVKHSKQLSEVFNKKGIPSEFICGSMSVTLRREILERFRKGEIKALFNCQLLTEGFDEPSIDALILARPTKSKGLYTQMVGRGVRLYPGKEECILVEVTDSYHKICDFKVTVGIPLGTFLDYEDGLSLSQLYRHRKIYEVSLEEIKVERINIFSDWKILEKKAPFLLLDKLKKRRIRYVNPLTTHEAMFLLWLDKLKMEIKNGIYSKN